MRFLGDKFRPRQLDELEADAIPVTVVSEPVAPDNVTAMPVRQRPLHARTL